MDVDRNSTTVIDDGDGIIRMDEDFDLRRVTRERFVDRVVDYFVNEVVESSRGRAPDVHAGTLPYCLETFQNLDLASVVAGATDHFSRCRLRHELPVGFRFFNCGFSGFNQT